MLHRLMVATTVNVEQNPAYCRPNHELLNSFTTKKRCYVKLISTLYNHLWITPFAIFVSTYFALHILLQSPSFTTPDITGMHLVEATKLLSSYQLHPEIIQIKEDRDMKAATILHQKPKAGRLIKKNQTVYVVISEKPAAQLAPSCIGLSVEQIKEAANAIGLKPKFYYIPYSYLSNRCFGQWPSAEQPIKNRSLICYIAQEKQNLVIYPDFKGQTLESVINALKEQRITHYQTDITPEPHRTYYILDQLPKAGSILNLMEPEKLIIQLKIGLKPVKV
jgi:beta-lactam-binding protein with PASTA domain